MVHIEFLQFKGPMIYPSDEYSATFFTLNNS